MGAIQEDANVTIEGADVGADTNASAGNKKKDRLQEY